MTEDQIIDGILEREGAGLPLSSPASMRITQRAWEDYQARNPQAAPVAAVALLTEPMARVFYRDVFVAPLRWINDDALRALAVDCAVNHGSQRATRWLQSAAGVDADAMIGPETRLAINRPYDWRDLYNRVLATRFKFYADIVARDTSQAVFLRGWINRACEFLR